MRRQGATRYSGGILSHVVLLLHVSADSAESAAHVQHHAIGRRRDVIDDVIFDMWRGAGAEEGNGGSRWVIASDERVGRAVAAMSCELGYVA